MKAVNESTFPSLYAQASQAARKLQFLFLSLVATNIILMAAPAAIDMVLLSSEHHEASQHQSPSPTEHKDEVPHGHSMGHAELLIAIDKLLVTLAGTTTLLVLFLPFRKDWLEARRLSESLKAHSWRFMAKAQPYSVSDEDAQELLLTNFASIAAGHKTIAGTVASEKVENKNLGDLQSVRDGSLEERISAYREYRLSDQVAYFTSKAASFQSKHSFFSAIVIVLQVVTFLCLTFGTSVDEITKSVALCIAASIGVLGWRDFRKYEEHSSSYGNAAQQLALMLNTVGNISTETDLSTFVSRVENLLSKEHKLWLLKVSEEGEEVETSLSQTKTIKRFRQKPLVYTAIRVESKTTVQTLEGEEEASSGDWIVTGSQGERWPVSSSTFAKKYKAVLGVEGSYRKLPVEVDAVQMNSSFAIETKWGKQTGSPGDWIIFSDAHDSYICKNAIFDTTYERILA